MTLVQTSVGTGLDSGLVDMKISTSTPNRVVDNLNLSDEFRSTDLYRCIYDNKLILMLDCIKRGDDVNFTCSKTENSYLHIIMAGASPITETKYVPMVYILSNANADLNILNKAGNSPMHLSITGHLLELMVALIKCGAACQPEADLELIASCSGPVEWEFRSVYRRFSPGYWMPVEEDKAFKVNVLVKSWCKVNISRAGKSLIEYAKEKSAQEKIVKMLIDNEVNIEFAHATIAGDADKMQFLLKHYSVDMDTKDYSHKENFFEPYCPLSLYGAALKYGHKHILYMLKNSEGVIVKQNEIPLDDAVVSPSPAPSSAVCSIL